MTSVGLNGKSTPPPRPVPLVLQVQQEIQRRWRRWRLTRHLPSRRRRQQHGSISHSGSPLTQVSLLPCSTGGPTAGGLPVDTLEV